MDDHIRINIEFLEQVSTILFRYLREGQGAEVSLDHDYYWSVPAIPIVDLDQAPTGLTVGQLSECMEWLHRVKKDPDSALAYHLVWLGDVLRAIGQAVVS